MSESDSARFSLPANPSLRHLKLQAKELLAQARTEDPSALRRIQPYQERQASGESQPLSLALAQLTIAREYGFASWTQLKIHVETAAQSFAEKLEVLLTEGWSWGDQRRAKAALESEPALATANIFSACICHEYDTVKALLAKSPALASTPGGPRHWVPLLYATWSCFLNERQDAAIKVIQHLLEAGADPKAKDAAGLTPLEWAIHEERQTSLGKIGGRNNEEVAGVIKEYIQGD
ncbi:MAG: ankyrin repeat domain-containing protein [Candidatus Omnitrophica bacterium]|nr:ankyrin repeat domain-containing protein [Candidatus Omnitrophota bacterium]